MTLYYSVADHIFALTRREPERVPPVSLNFAPFRIDYPSSEPLFEMVLDQEVVPRSDAPTQIFDYDLEDGDCTLCIYDDEYRLTLRSRGKEATVVCPFARSNYRFGPTCRFYTDMYFDGRSANGIIYDHALVFAYSFATLPCKTLLIHSSVIVRGGAAVMCLGESGTGKSTHTRLWLENIEGTERLNDDGPVVRVMNDGSVRVYGSPWSGKGCVWKQEWRPIAAFLRLSQGPANVIKELSKFGAFGALLPSTLPTLQKEERTLDQICATLSDILTTTKAYHLSCLPDAAAAHLSCSTIFGE